MISKSTTKCLLGFFICSLAVYTLMTYGGIRSPDSEIMFRTGLSLATQGTFAQTEDLDSWREFGLPKGMDGKRYSIFGPTEAIVSVPFVKLALLINSTGWYEKVPWIVPLSYIVGDGLSYSIHGERPQNVEPHALRLVMCLFNIVVGSLGVVVFFLLIHLLTDSNIAASYVTVLYAFGSLIFAYTGTFLSEPLATLFVMLSLYSLIWNEIDIERRGALSCHFWNLVVSGVFLGLAVTTHITAILFMPFFAAYAIYPYFHRTSSLTREVFLSGACFAIGCGIFLCLLGYFNYVRFGNPLETGRTVDPRCLYAKFTSPWVGLHGLLWSSGKGILWYCPAVLAGIFLARPFYKKKRFLTLLIFSSFLFRLLFIASREDWNACICLGPRYLVLIIPLLLLPLGEVVVQWSRDHARKQLGALHVFSVLCILEQIYMNLGEVFLFYYGIMYINLGNNFDIFADNQLYFRWEAFPLLHLMEWDRGPFLLKWIPCNNWTLFFLMSTTTVVILFYLYRSWFSQGEQKVLAVPKEKNAESSQLPKSRRRKSSRSR